MAVPTFNAVTPSTGATGGDNLVEITGSNFKLWAIPAPTGGPAGPLRPTVQVLFGNVPASKVQVISATRLLARVPRTPLAMTGPNYGEGAASITIRNLDSDGVPIPGESVTQAGAYTFQRVQLANESDLTRLIRTLVREINTQVMANVSVTTHTDYDPDTGDMLNTTALAKLPALTLIGPELAENRFYSINKPQTYRVGSGPESVTRRVPYTVDISFVVLGAARLHVEAMNLMVATQLFFERNKYLLMDRDPADSSKGQVRYVMDIPPGDDLKMDPTPSDSNVHSFSGRMRVIGFDLEDLTGFAGNQVVSRTAQITEDPGILTEQIPEG